jgi:hypothetical protein
MRFTLTCPVNCLILAVVALGLWFQTALAADRQGLLGTVKGWGENKQQAKDYALEKVKDRVEKHLRRQAPGLEWFPPKDYINDHFLKEPAQRRADQDQEVDNVNNVQCWEWTVEVTPQDWEEILRHNRDIRVQRRMGLLGKILAGLLVLLGVAVGYVRLDEWTKGFYTIWLRLAAGGILAAAGTGLWWLS